MAKNKNISFKEEFKECINDNKSKLSNQLPSNRDLKYQSLQEMECSTCIYNEHCYGNCLKATRLFSEENKNKNIKEVIVSIHNNNNYREDYYDEIYSFKLYHNSIKRYFIDNETFKYIPDNNNDDKFIFKEPIKCFFIEDILLLINSLLMENETISSCLAFLSESESNNKNIKDSIFHNYYDFRNKINNLQ